MKRLTLIKALANKDRYTAQHSLRVAQTALLLGRSLALPQTLLETLTIGALLHDVGKLAVPDPILNKATPLDEPECRIMRLHPIYSAALLLRAGAPEPYAAVAAAHHERWDGGGYPLRLRGEEIPLAARVVAIADTWDAMTGDRVYRQGLPVERATAILRAERDGGQFQPELLDRFLDLIAPQSMEGVLRTRETITSRALSQSIWRKPERFSSTPPVPPRRGRSRRSGPDLDWPATPSPPSRAARR